MIKASRMAELRYVHLLLVFSLIGATTASSSASVPIVEQGGSIAPEDRLRLVVSEEHTQPMLRIVLPDSSVSDRTIEVLFPEHVTVVEHGTTNPLHLYIFQPGLQGTRPVWRQTDRSLEYERELPGGVKMIARATLEQDGVRFSYEFTNDSNVTYDMVNAVTDPRLTSAFHDLRLERTFVHHEDGFDLLAAETPERLTLPLDQWLPSRYLVSYNWPVPAKLFERREGGVACYNKSRPVDQPFIATLSQDGSWVVASFTRETGNVWSNPELTCQHVDPQGGLAPGQTLILEIKILVVRGTLEEAFERAVRQRGDLN